MTRRDTISRFRGQWWSVYASDAVGLVPTGRPAEEWYHLGEGRRPVSTNPQIGAGMQVHTLVAAIDQIIEHLNLSTLEDWTAQYSSLRVRLPDIEKDYIGFSRFLFDLEAGCTIIQHDPILNSVALATGVDEAFARDTRIELLQALQNSKTLETIVDLPPFERMVNKGIALRLISRALHVLIVDPQDHPTDEADSTLSIEVHDAVETGVPVQTVADVLNGIATLYNAVALFRDVPGSIPRIRWIESGSDIKINVEGLAPVVAEMRRTLREVFTGFWFSKNAKFEKNLRTAIKATVLVKELEAIVERGGPAGVEAAKAQRLVLQSITEIARTGAMIADLDQTPADEGPLQIAATTAPRRLSPGQPIVGSGTEE